MKKKQKTIQWLLPLRNYNECLIPLIQCPFQHTCDIIQFYYNTYTCKRNGDFVKRASRRGYKNSLKKSLTFCMVWFGGAHDLMVIIVGNGHGDTSSNPGRD